MDEMKARLNKYIEMYGLMDKRTINLSQELDKIICKEQRKILSVGQ